MDIRQDGLIQLDASDWNTSRDVGASSMTNGVKRPRPIACVMCRRRKLKCDSAKPRCGTCIKHNYACEYSEVKKKSGPKSKAGEVAHLVAKSNLFESRLAMLEDKLTQERKKSAMLEASQNGIMPSMMPDENLVQPDELASIEQAIEQSLHGFRRSNDEELIQRQATYGPPAHPVTRPFVEADRTMVGNATNSTSDFDRRESSSSRGFSTSSTPSLDWCLLPSGLDEPLPPPDLIREMETLYFKFCATTMPMIHKARYLAACNLPPSLGPPLALRYAIWLTGVTCSSEPRHRELKDTLYNRVTVILEHNRRHINTSNASLRIGELQALCLVAIFEFMQTMFPQAWATVGRAGRLALYLNLYTLDGAKPPMKTTIPAPRDFIELEERRRTLWVTYEVDRLASVGTGWPFSLQDADILTRLPTSNEDFALGIESKGQWLHKQEFSMDMGYEETRDGNSVSEDVPSEFGFMVRVLALHGKITIHSHRPQTTEEFVKNHKELEAMVAHLLFSIPFEFRYKLGMKSDAVYLHLILHTYEFRVIINLTNFLERQSFFIKQQLQRRKRKNCH